MAQRTTKGDSFPAEPSDGDIHVLTSDAKLPAYQYQTDSWVQITGLDVAEMDWNT